MSRIPWALSVLAVLLLSYHGGLHPWQQALASALVLAALLAGRHSLPAWSSMQTGERALALLLAAALPGVLLSLRPQESLNAWAALGALVALGLLLRRVGGAFLPALQASVLLLGAGYSVLFLLLGMGSGAMLPPLEAARLLQPNQNILAGSFSLPALLLALALLLAGRKGWAAGGASLVLGFASLAVVYAGSRGAYLAFLGGAAWLALRWPAPRRAFLVQIALFACVLSLLAWKAPFSGLALRLTPDSPVSIKGDSNSSRRLDFWKGALQLSLQRPLAGHGLGAFEAAAWSLDLPTQLTPEQPIARYRLALEHAHNDLLELAVEAGWVIALAALVLLAIWAHRRSSIRPASAGILGLEAGVVSALVLALVDMNLHTPAVIGLLVLTVAAIEPMQVPAKGQRHSDHWLLFGALGLVFSVGWMLRQGALHQLENGQEPSQRTLTAALFLQPADARLAMGWQARGHSPWPLASWAGRQDPRWHLNEAARLGSSGDIAGGLQATRRAVALRPFYAPYRFLLAERLLASGFPREADQAIEEALRLEPNYSQALAWQALRGDPKLLKARVQRLHEIQNLRVSSESVDEYTRGIQGIDQNWLFQISRKLALSTGF